MPFPFAYVCDHLEYLETLVVGDKPILHRTLQEHTTKRTVSWLQSHRDRINASDSDAIMRTFQPHSPPDRVYGLDPESLQQIIARVLHVPRGLFTFLNEWRSVPGKTLSVCVKNVMERLALTKQLSLPIARNDEVTVEQIDEVLRRIALHHQASLHSTESQAAADERFDVIDGLAAIYKRLSPRDAKWLTRVILKDFGHVRFPDHLDYSARNSRLPNCVQVRAQFTSSMPETLRREGPGLMKLKRIARSARKATPPRPVSPPRRVKSVQLPVQLLPNSTCTKHVDFTTAPTAASIMQACLNDGVASNTGKIVVATPNHRSITLSGSPGRYPLASQSTDDLPKRHSPVRCNSNTHVPRSHNVLSVSVSLKPPREPLTDMSPNLSPESISKAASRIRTNAERESPISICGTGRCQLTKSKCLLANCIFVLAPCIAENPYINDSLLRWHGCRMIKVKDVFSIPNVSRMCAETGKKHREMLLVESHRPKQTAAFLRRFGNLKLKAAGQETHWMEVYDWRILECIAKVDCGKKLAYDPWKRCWIGAV